MGLVVRFDDCELIGFKGSRNETVGGQMFGCS